MKNAHQDVTLPVGHAGVGSTEYGIEIIVSSEVPGAPFFALESEIKIKWKRDLDLDPEASWRTWDFLAIHKINTECDEYVSTRCARITFST